jgi:hypothetical protein
MVTGPSNEGYTSRHQTGAHADSTANNASIVFGHFVFSNCYSLFVVRHNRKCEPPFLPPRVCRRFRESRAGWCKFRTQQGLGRPDLGRPVCICHWDGRRSSDSTGRPPGVARSTAWKQYAVVGMDGRILSIASTLTGLTLAQKLGSGLYTGITLTASLLTSILLDKFGLMGFKPRPLSSLRMTGAGLMVAGIWLIARF